MVDCLETDLQLAISGPWVCSLLLTRNLSGGLGARLVSFMLFNLFELTKLFKSAQIFGLPLYIHWLVHFRMRGLFQLQDQEVNLRLNIKNIKQGKEI